MSESLFSYSSKYLLSANLCQRPCRACLRPSNAPTPSLSGPLPLEAITPAVFTFSWPNLPDQSERQVVLIRHLQSLPPLKPSITLPYHERRGEPSGPTDPRQSRWLFLSLPPHTPPRQLRKCKWSSSWAFLLFLMMERMFLAPPCHCCGPLPSQTILPWRPHLCPGSLNPHAQSLPDPVVPSESWAIHMARLMDIPANIIPALQTPLPYSCVPSSKCFLPTPISPQDTDISLLPRFSLAPRSRQQTSLAQSSFQSPIPFPSSSLTHSLIPLLPCLQPPIAASYSPSRNNHSPPSLHHLTPLFQSVPTSPNASHPESSAPARWASVPSPKPTPDHAHLPSSQLLKQHSLPQCLFRPFSSF